jgi:hypothetical protein
MVAALSGARVSSRTLSMLIALALAGLIALSVWAFPKLFKPVTEERPLPPTGEAAYNPLYALKLALRAQGRDAQGWPNLTAAEHALADDDTLLLYDRPEAMGEAQAQRILDWVRRGGHLVMPGPPGRADAGPLASALGLRALEPKPDKSSGKGEAEEIEDLLFSRNCVALRAAVPARRGQETWLCDPPFAPVLPGFRLGGGDAVSGWRFARRELGRGLVTVAELDYLDNERLRRPEVRAMAFQLLAPSLGKGRMHLVYSADVPSLLRLLLMNAWMVLLPLLCALAAWLAWRGQRFGPLQAAPDPRRRALLEHVQAAGEFAWARGRGLALHAALLRLFHRRLALRDPLLAALDADGQARALSERLSLPLSRVRQALHPQGLQQPAAFTQSIATLLQMRSRL